MNQRSMRRRGGSAASTLLLTAALVSTACGSTAYRDKVEVTAVQGSVTTGAGGSSTSVPSGSSPGLSAEGGGEDVDGSAGTDDTTTVGGTVAGGSGSSSNTGSTGSSGSTGPSGSTGSSTGGSGSNSGGAGTSTGGSGTTSGGSGSTGGGTTIAGRGNGRGVTDSTVQVGFVKLGAFRNLSASLGFTASELGDVDGQIESLTKWVNNNGGLAGRTMESHIIEYTQEEASPGNEAQICNAHADDNNVFAVVFQGQIYPSTRECYAGKGVLMFDPSPFIFDQKLANDTAPYYWSPSYPVYDRVIRALVPELQAQDYFTPDPTRGETATVIGVLRWDYPFAKRLYDDVMVPELAKVGQTVTTVHAVDGSNAGTIQAGLGNAVARFQASGVNHVLFIGGSPLAPFFYLNAANQDYEPRYGVTTLDGPRHTASSGSTNPEQMIGAVGIGFNPVNDVLDDQWAFPGKSNQTEKFCLDMYAADGHTWTSRANAQAALAYCESILMLKAGASELGPNLNAEDWAVVAEGFGNRFLPATTFGATFGPQRHHGANAYRPLAHDITCQCMTYVGPEKPL